MKVPYLDVKNQYNLMKEEIDAAIRSVIEDCSFIRGAYVEEFEKNFCEFLGGGYGLGVGNGTDALEIAIQALGIEKGSEVIVPSFTFIACPEAVIRNDLVPVFCDVDPQTYTLDTDDLKNLINPKTKLIMAVHQYGHACHMDEIMRLAEENDLFVIEDCSQAHGALYKGRLLGTFGRMATFSFYPGKNLGAFGDAGFIFSHHKDSINACRMIANHGRVEKYVHEFVGRNSRMDGIQGAVLNVKLKSLNEWNQRRSQVAALYDEGLKDLEEVIIPEIEDWCDPVYHLYVLRVKNRDKLQRFLTDKGIGTGVHYPLALTQQPPFKGSRDRELFADQLGSEVLSLPMGEHLTDDQVSYVVSAVREFYS